MKAPCLSNSYKSRVRIWGEGFQITKTQFCTTTMMMMTITPNLVFLLGFVCIIGLSFATNDHGDTSIDFTYSGSAGPEKWGSLSPEFKACSDGKKQSPVNIVKDQLKLNKNLKPLIRNYQPANATLINGHVNIGMHYDEHVGALVLNGKNYSLKQMHWHSPSEHQIDGVKYPAELHLVHMTSDGNIAVVGIIYKYGDADPLISKIQKALEELASDDCSKDEESRVDLGTIDLKHFRKKTRKYFTYIGSLTTPPCTENVVWNILGKVRTISKEQVAALKAPLEETYKNNSRPTQSLNGRQVELYNELHDGDDDDN